MTIYTEKWANVTVNMYNYRLKGNGQTNKNVLTNKQIIAI